MVVSRRKDKYGIMIEEIMQMYEIDPNVVPNGKKGCVVVFCHGQFTCKDCTDKTWNSAWSWIKFDLRNQRIKYRYHQKCNVCLTPTKPYFADENMKKVIEKAVRKLERQLYPEEAEVEEMPHNGQIDRGNDMTEEQEVKMLLKNGTKSTKTHLQILCEKCGYGEKEACYLKVFRKYKINANSEKGRKISY